MLMITEYCSHGDLLNFLRGRAQDNVASMVTVDEVQEEAFYKNMAAQHARLRRCDASQFQSICLSCCSHLCTLLSSQPFRGKERLSVPQHTYSY